MEQPCSQGLLHLVCPFLFARSQAVLKWFSSSKACSSSFHGAFLGAVPSIPTLKGEILAFTALKRFFLSSFHPCHLLGCKIRPQPLLAHLNFAPAAWACALSGPSWQTFPSLSFFLLNRHHPYSAKGNVHGQGFRGWIHRSMLQYAHFWTYHIGSVHKAALCSDRATDIWATTSYRLFSTGNAKNRIRPCL